MPYFSEREEGARPRDLEDIGEGPWGGIHHQIRRYLAKGSFTAMTDESEFRRALRADIPHFSKNEDLAMLPPTLVALDVIEFCWRLIEKPTRVEDPRPFEVRLFPPGPVSQGRKEFREAVNQIFRRNGLVYELRPEGHVERLVPREMRELLEVTRFRSGDEQLDQMLETALQKFVDPDEEVRRDGLDNLWGAFERLKTTAKGRDKKEGAKAILDEVAGSESSKFRIELDREAQALTRIGNSFLIRHKETTQERLARPADVDFLFYRLLAFINLILRRPSPKGAGVSGGSNAASGV